MTFHYIAIVNGALTALLSVAVLLPVCKADSQIAQSQHYHHIAANVGVDSDHVDKAPNISNTHTTDYLMGKFNPAKNPLFVKIPRKYASQAGMYLRKEALDAFINMQNSAKRSGVQLTIRSATRSFDRQKHIWERKWSGKKRLSDGTNAKKIKNQQKRALRILEYSSMPGTSRHHWGSDIDLNAFTNTWFESGKGLRLFNWMTANAWKFGFCRPYTANRPTGYQEEKWHWSYTPLSSAMLKSVPSLLHDHQISGFRGSATAAQIGIVDKYILSVDSACK